MCIAIRASSLLLLLSLALSPTCLANDSAFGGTGVDLVPLKHYDVEMASEDITLVFEDRYWKVSADYVFRSVVPAPLSVQMGFPEYRCGEIEEGDCAGNPDKPFVGLRTWVRGQEVSQRRGRVAPEHAWAPRLGVVWTYDVTFASEESLRIRHTYEIASSNALNLEYFVTYVTRTGALWRGPIGRARFTFRVPETAILGEGWFSPKDLPMVAQGIVERDGRRQVEIVFEATAWAPVGDIHFRFGHRDPRYFSYMLSGLNPYDGSANVPWTPGATCPPLGRLYEAVQDGGDTTALLAEVAALDLRSRRVCANSVFALYGHRFANDQWNRYFYEGASGDARFTVNPWYRPEQLTRLDWQVLHALEGVVPEEPSALVAPAVPDAGTFRVEAAPAMTTPAPPRHASCGCRLAGSSASAPGASVALGLSFVGWCLRSRRRATDRKNKTQFALSAPCVDDHQEP